MCGIDSTVQSLAVLYSADKNRLAFGSTIVSILPYYDTVPGISCPAGGQCGGTVRGLQQLGRGDTLGWGGWNTVSRGEAGTLTEGHSHAGKAEDTVRLGLLGFWSWKL